MKNIKFKPDTRLLQISVVLVCLGLISSIWVELESIWLSTLVLVFTVSLFDLLRVAQTPAPLIKRSISGALSVGVSHQVHLKIKNISYDMIII